MWYLSVELINNTPQMLTLNNLTNLKQGQNMYITDASLTVSRDGGQCPVASNASLSASMTYNITEQMVLVIQWSLQNAPPTSFSAGVQGGTEYTTTVEGPVVTNPDSPKNYLYSYTVTVS